MLTSNQKRILRQRFKGYTYHRPTDLLALIEDDLNKFLREAEHRGVLKGEEERKQMVMDAIDGSGLQKLVDVCMQIGLTASSEAHSKFFKGKSIEQRAMWIAEQLRECGFDTEPCGANWARLKR